MTARFQLDVRADAGGFQLRVQASWDAPVAAVFGPSGSGKSTLLEVIAGLRRAEGRIALDGATLLDSAAGLALPPQARGTGWVPQEASLFPHLTVGENVLFGARRRARDDRPAPPPPRQLAELLEIAPLWDQPASTLSGGERQRTAIARALASGPRILLLDEPLAALDLPLRARIHPYLVRVRDELRVPMLYVSHDPHELLGLAGVALRLGGGRLEACGDPRDVLWAASAAATLAPRENRLQGRVVSRPEPGLLEVALDEGGRLFVAGDAAEGARVLVEFRAEDVLLAAERPGTLSAQNVLPARVAALEQAGGAVIVRLFGPMPLAAQVTHRAAESLKLAPGREVWAVLKAHSARALVG